MTIVEVRKMRAALEDQIKTLVIDFEDRTGCFVEAIDVDADRETIDITINTIIKP